jgi:cytochrome c553
MRTLLGSAAALIALASFASGAAAQQAVQGKAQAGEKKAAMCAGCHSIPGYQASFPEVHKVPMIAGQTATYLQAALAAYKSGDRRHPTMKAIAVSLSEQDMADLAAYFAGLPASKPALDAKPARAPSPEVAALIERGKAQNQNCASCHGENFSSPKDPSYPKLAGQHADYLYVALKAYETEGNPHIGRSNPVMSGMAAGFTHAQLKEIARYIGSLPGELQVVPQSRFK